MLRKCCTQYANKFGKLSSGHGTGKGPISIPIPKKGNAKECSNYRTIALISHSSKVMLKILQARLQQYMNCELPDVQAGLEKAEQPEIKLPTSTESSKKHPNNKSAKTAAQHAHSAPYALAPEEKAPGHWVWCPVDRTEAAQTGIQEGQIHRHKEAALW